MRNDVAREGNEGDGCFLARKLRNILLRQPFPSSIPTRCVSPRLASPRDDGTSTSFDGKFATEEEWEHRLRPHGRKLLNKQYFRSRRRLSSSLNVLLLFLPRRRPNVLRTTGLPGYLKMITLIGYRSLSVTDCETIARNLEGHGIRQAFLSPLFIVVREKCNRNCENGAVKRGLDLYDSFASSVENLCIIRGCSGVGNNRVKIIVFDRGR